MANLNELKQKNPKLVEILEKMCEMVGVKIEDVDFDDENWFWQYEWTIDEEKQYTDWLAEKIINDKQLRKDVFDCNIQVNLGLARSLAKMFVFNWGWKLKDDIDS